MTHQLVEDFGEGFVLALARRYPGVRCYVPKRGQRCSRAFRDFAADVDPRTLARFIARYAGVVLMMPVGIVRAARVLELTAQGLSVSQIARELWSSERHVYMVRAAARRTGVYPLPESPRVQARRTPRQSSAYA